MKNAVFVVMDQYADYEGGYLASQLNQSQGWSVKTASVNDEVTSLGGFRTRVDEQLDQLSAPKDLLVLIGGNSWSVENQSLRSLIATRLKTNQPVAAICGSVDYLARNGLLTGYRHTGNSQELWRGNAKYTNNEDFVATQAVADRNLVTANGTAALEFTNLALKMIHFLSDHQVDLATNLYQLGFYKYCQKYGNPF